VQKAIKEIRNRKAAGDVDIRRDALNIFGEVGLKILTKLINIIYETEEWPMTSQTLQ